MRHVVILLFLVLVVVLSGCGGSSGRLVGAWELVSAGADSTGGPSAPQLIHTVKILSKEHFAFGQRTAQGSVVAGGGRYTYDGKSYVERIDYHWMPGLMGLSMRFDCRLEENLWYHSGQFRVGSESFTVNEVWRKIEE